MSKTIVESSAASFQADVLDASADMPVLVDFWADWCQPCKMLAPTLEKVAAGYAGRARIAKVNSDSEQALAARYGIRSLPTLLLFRNGQPAEQIVGVQPEGAIAALLDKYLPRPTDADRAEAARLLDTGRAPEAVLLLEKVLREDPNDEDARIELIEALAQSGMTAQADAMFAALPVNAMDAPRLKVAEARLHLAKAVAGAPPLAELERQALEPTAGPGVLHQLAVREFLAGRIQPAFERLLGLMTTHRSFGDDLARRTLLYALQLVDGHEDLVHGYRRRMMALMH